MATAKGFNRSNSVPGNKFDIDLGGLYKAEQTQIVLGKKVRFIPPTAIQRALVIKFLTLAMQELVTTPNERNAMSQDQLLRKCLEKLSLLEQFEKDKSNEAEALAIAGQMFSNAEANEYLLEAIEHCYPDLINPHLLTDDAIATASTSLFLALKEEIR